VFAAVVALVLEHVAQVFPGQYAEQAIAAGRRPGELEIDQGRVAGLRNDPVGFLGQIVVDDTGSVLIYATDQTSAQRAKLMVQRSAGVLQVGRCYRGTVTGVKDFGAFVKINAVNEGLVPIEELDKQHVARVSDVAREGEEMIVTVLGADDRGRLRLSRRQALGVDEAQIEF